VASHPDVTELLVDRRAIASTELRSGVLGPLSDGDVRVTIERFALTANNVTYAQFGDMLAYWDFFPVTAEWGHVPAMGWGRIDESSVDGLAVGTRLYGWWPMATSVDLTATPTVTGLRDDGAHRAPHAPAYRAFTRTDADPLLPARADDDVEDRHALLRGLFLTGFLIDAFFASRAWLGAEQAVVLSASSKTAIGFAHAARAHGAVRLVGATSSANLAFVERVGLYDQVVTYDDLAGVDSVPTVVVDVAGAGATVAALHERLGDRIAYSMIVGKSHHDAPPAAITSGPQPEMFFAPGEIEGRLAEWGAAEYQRRAAEGLHAFIEDSRHWLTVEQHAGPPGAQGAWTELVAGNVRPDRGLIVSLHAD
jgi:hypothetical protein